MHNVIRTYLFLGHTLLEEANANLIGQCSRPLDNHLILLGHKTVLAMAGLEIGIPVPEDRNGMLRSGSHDYRGSVLS